MAASTITRVTWTDGAAGTVINNARKNSDIYDKIDEMFAGAGSYTTFTLGGLLVVEGFGTHAFNASGTGPNLLSVRNASAGTTNYGGLWVGNNSSSSRGNLQMHSTTFTTVADAIADGLRLRSEGAGGLALSTSHASGTMKFFTGTTPTERMRISETGFFGIGGTPSASAGVRATGTYTFTGAGAAGHGLLIDPTITADVNFGGYQVSITGGTINEAASGAHALFAGLRVDAPTIGAGGATVTNTATVYISGAPSGGTTGNYGFWCQGLSRFDISVLINQAAVNTFQTMGLTINQGTADDESLALKSSDVAHGVTGVAETDTYGAFLKASATTGGLQIQSLGESTLGLYLFNVATSADTAKATTSVAPFMVDSRLKSGVGTASLGANANIAVFQDLAVTRFILDSDGDSHQDVGTAWTNFDDHDDIALLHALSAGVSRKGDPLKRAFGQFLVQHRRTLERAKLVTFNEDGHHFINWSRTHMLTIGAVRQLAARCQTLERRLLALEA